jgi:hypothetical protein
VLIASANLPERWGGVLAGGRAPDATLKGAGGQRVRLFDLLKGPSWTLIDYEAGRTTQAPRRGLRMHVIGSHGDLIDSIATSATLMALGMELGCWRPDGYVGAVVSAEYAGALDDYLPRIGLGG